MLKTIASYCSTVDAVRLSQASRKTRLALSLLTVDCKIWDEQRWVGSLDDRPQFVRQIPIVVSGQLLQSIRLCCVWRDQGWGNRKGRLFVSTSKTVFSQDSVVVQSDEAQHDDDTLVLEFKPRQGMEYYLWRFVGQGGGHRLVVQDLEAQHVLFDTCRLVWTHNLNALCAAAASSSAHRAEIKSLATTILEATSSSPKAATESQRRRLCRLGFATSRESLFVLLHLIKNANLCEGIRNGQVVVTNNSRSLETKQLATSDTDRCCEADTCSNQSMVKLGRFL